VAALLQQAAVVEHQPSPITGRLAESLVATMQDRGGSRLFTGSSLRIRGGVLLFHARQASVEHQQVGGLSHPYRAARA